MDHLTQRPRSKSNYSTSDRSDKSHGSKSKDVHEHKRHLSGTSKSNPNAAMEEAQPIAAALEKATLGSLRAIEHKDIDGTPIPEPDLSNPTRSRWERPLDTIRKHEAQIDGKYNRRASVVRSESTPDFSGYTSRRSSYYGGGGYDSNRHSNANGYYGNRGTPKPYDDSFNPPVAAPSRNRYGQRLQAEAPPPPRGPGQPRGPYPVPFPVSHSYQHSRDTVNTGLSNSSGEPWGNSTDPSSENSSIERAIPAPVPKPDLAEQYGFNGFGGNPIMEEYDHAGPQGYAPPVGDGAYYTQNQSGPPVPTHGGRDGNVLKLGDGPPEQPIGAAPTRRPLPESADGERRKSWFKRRFSKD